MTDPKAKVSRSNVVPVVAVFCVLLAVLWQLAVLLVRSTPPVENVDPARFAKLELVWNGQKAFRALPGFDDAQANLLVLAVPLAPAEKGRPPRQATLRLVHGYNMRDCMRIKGYEVGPLTNMAPSLPGASPQRIDAWELLSSGGERTIWVTAILRAADFSYMPISVTNLAFPRVGIPDDLNWEFKGASLDTVKHPVRNFRDMLRSKWNSSRCDLATLLKLRKPAQPSSQLLTVAAFAVLPRQQDRGTTQQELTRLLQEFVNALQGMH